MKTHVETVYAAETERRLRAPAAPARAIRWIGVSAIVFVIAALVLPFVGQQLDWSAVWHRQNPDWSILTRLRVSRTVLALFAGGALALAGSLFQSMLRDALATPYTLGVSTGASLGAVSVIALGLHTIGGIAAVWGGAAIGAIATLFVVIGAASSRGSVSSGGLLLAGVAINSVCVALILVVHSFSGVSQSFAISRWLIGSLDALAFGSLAIYVALVSAVAMMILRRAKSWNLLSIGEEWAATRGVDVQRLIRAGYGTGSVLAATTVALVGPIGFVGLVVPHLLRKHVGGDDRIVMPCAFLLGGVLLAACDAIGRVVLAPAEVPAGAITALIGGPYLVWMVRRGGRR